MTRLRGEHGGIMVLAAVTIPLFLLICALVIDVGDWYTHKRQLQNRADAGAFAAGIEYAKNWKACVQTSDPALKASTAREIANAARQYSADPEAADYAPDALPSSLYNTEIANQAKLDVMINSPNYTNNNDYNDDGGTTQLANPCFLHNPGDDISAAGEWTDVKVKERDLPSLFGAIGLPLSQNLARARIEIRPALSGRRFLPLAIPNTVITKVQVRYYDECRDPSHTSPLATKDLAPFPAADQAGFAASGGGTLWGLPLVDGDLSVGDKNRAFPLTVPSYGGCSQDYLPIGVEVRIASRDEVNLNQSCSTLIAIDFADCFTRISQFRVFSDGDPDNQVRITPVKITGGCGAPADPYFSTLPVGANNCSFGVTADVNWGSRDDGNLNVPANFTVSANGQAMTLVTPTSGQSGTWATTGTPITFAPGGNAVTITVNWADTNTSHSWAGDQCKSGNNNPCKYNATENTHRAVVGTDSDQFPASAYTGAVALVRTSQSSFVSGLPGPPLENVNTGGGAGIPPSPIAVFPTVGTRSPLKTGVVTTLRADDSQGTGLLRCDPDYANGQAFDAFRYGCKPWYGKNSFTSGPWWNTSTNECPNPSLWFSYGANPSPYLTNTSTNPWRCVLTAPGGKTGQVGDWMSVATKNCSNINSNACQTISCLNEGNYDGKSGSPVGWKQQGGDSAYPRVINLFIVPYQSLKTKQGSGDPIPVLGFASFYVMDWGGVNNDNDPCPDPDFDQDNNPATPQITLPTLPSRSIRGVFVEKVEYEPGPVDSTAICAEGDLTPCRVTLVR